jgi:hypothetical protein
MNIDKLVFTIMLDIGSRPSGARLFLVNRHSGGYEIWLWRLCIMVGAIRVPDGEAYTIGV